MDDLQPYDVADEDKSTSTLSHGGETYAPPRHPVFQAALGGAELDFLHTIESVPYGDRPKIPYLGYPPKSMSIVRMLTGNGVCVDCGNNRDDQLLYASVGYGTLLCKECAIRHGVLTSRVSLIKGLFDEQWSLLESLALLEGGNTRMLEYLKTKPKWKPPKGDGDTPADAKDIAAFKQIYFSKGAASYRRKLVERTVRADNYQTESATLAEAEAVKRAREKRKSRATNATVSAGPLDHIFESMGILRDDVDRISQFDMAVGGGAGGTGDNRNGRTRGAAEPKQGTDDSAFANIKERIARRLADVEGGDTGQTDGGSAAWERSPGGPSSPREGFGGDGWHREGAGAHMERKGRDIVGEVSEMYIDDEGMNMSGTRPSTHRERNPRPGQFSNASNHLVGEDDAPIVMPQYAAPGAEGMGGAKRHNSNGHRRRSMESAYEAPLGTYRRVSVSDEAFGDAPPGPPRRPSVYGAPPGPSRRPSVFRPGGGG